MFSDCSFEKHILSVSSRCSRLAGWILRTFASRDKITMLTLFKSLVLSRLDYGSQLWSPFKAKDIRLLESVQSQEHSLSIFKVCILIVMLIGCQC